MADDVKKQENHDSVQNFRIEAMKVRGFDIDPGHIVTLELFESITFPGITGMIELKDWAGLKELGEVMGGDEIELSWGAPGQEPISFVGVVSAAPPEQHSPKQTFVTTRFEFCSKWLMDSFGRQITKEWKNKYVHEIVADLVSMCGGEVKSYHPSTTTKLERFVSPLWTPIHTIKHLLSFAVGGGCGGYLLFQDIEDSKLVLATIDQLYAGVMGSNPNEIGKHTGSIFYEGNAGKIDIEQTFDTMRFRNQSMGLGHFAGFDMDRGTIFQTNLPMSGYTHTHLGSAFPLLSSDVGGDFASTWPAWNHPSTDQRTASNNDIKSLIEGKLKTRYSLQFGDVFKVNIGTPGSTERKVGQLVKFNFPSVDSNADASRRNRHMEGMWLVRNIRHIMTDDSYTQAVTLVCDGYKLTERNDLLKWG